jgi:hypothetical protein
MNNHPRATSQNGMPRHLSPGSWLAPRRIHMLPRIPSAYIIISCHKLASYTLESPDFTDSYIVPLQIPLFRQPHYTKKR